MAVAAWLLMALAPALVLAGTPPSDATVALAGEWRAASGPATAKAFDPSRLTSFGRPPGGARVSLRPRTGDWPPGPWVLSVESAGFQRVTAFPPGMPPQRAQLLSPDPPRPAFGRLAFEVPVPPPSGQPLQVHVDARGALPSPMVFVVRGVAEQARVEARWLAFATACLATMLVTALIALFFGLRLRDPAFAYYALYVATYALIQGAQTGYLAQPLDWDTVARTLPHWGRAVTATSVVAAVLFLDRFVDLRQRLPRLRRVLMGYCVVMALLVMAGQVPVLQGPVRGLVNPLLILGGPLVLGAAVAAACRGSRFALLFLLGWTPLLAVTVMGSLQLYGVAPDWHWTDDAALAAGAFEAVVLALGLAERAASVRRQRDQARELAGIDPLTGILNRRAWREAAQALLDRPGPVSVLFLDLDHFKDVNDRYGHDAGDHALRAFSGVLGRATRERDLVGRYGGEEFVVALPVTGAEEAASIAERVRAELRDDPGVRVTVSIGAATRREGESLDDLLRRADTALYAAKHGGRDRVVEA